jgi:LPXTG-motif cell wall-anchored protein
MGAGSLTIVSGFAVAAASASSPSITTLAGNGTRGYSGDGGVAVKAELNVPTGVAVDATGALYIGDSVDNRVRKVVSPTAQGADLISTYAGNGTQGFKGDGGLATAAELNTPTGVALDSSGDLFIADTGNNRIREVTLSTLKISTIAGTGSCTGNAQEDGDGGPALSASLCAPTGVTVDLSGDVFISDTGHNEVREVVKSTGKIVDFAGGNGPKCGYSGDGGTATKAQLCAPSGLVMNSLGNLYIADTGNTVVREVSGGKISTFAGNGKLGYSGDGGPATKAELDGPTGVGVDGSGDVFISDTLNNRIREVIGSTITTYAGNGTRGFTGDGGAATSAELNTPTGNVAANSTAVYFADTGNERVRGVFTGPPPVLPQTNVLIFLPIGAGLILAGGSVLVIRRRRKLAPTVTG